MTARRRRPASPEALHPASPHPAAGGAGDGAGPTDHAGPLTWPETRTVPADDLAALPAGRLAALRADAFDAAVDAEDPDEAYAAQAASGRLGRALGRARRRQGGAP